MIVLIGGEKGGTGKSTIATNLASGLARSGEDVLLLDSDRQATSSNWTAERDLREELPRIHCVQRYGNLFKTLQDLRSRYGQIVVDAGGRDSEELRSAMVLADKIYSPLRASQSDLWTVEHVNKLVGMARAMNPGLKAYALLSMAPTNPKVTEADDAAEMLAEFSEMKMAKSKISDRKVFRDALCDGLGVVECGDEKASQEILAFVKEIYGGKIQTKIVANLT